jgi:type II secretion system protein N
MTPERFRMIRRTLGIGAFGAVVFVISFMLAFPYERVKDTVVAQAAAANLDVEVGSTGPLLGFGVVMKDVVVRTRPALGEKPAVMSIEEARLSSSPLVGLKGQTAYDNTVSLDTLGGQVDIESSGVMLKHGETRVMARELGLNELSGSRGLIPLPLAGRLDMNLEMVLPTGRYGEGNGAVDWKWAGAAIGDGKEKLRVAGNPFLSEGIVIPRVRLGDFKGKVVFQKGVGKLQGVGAKSQDGELRMEGEIRLADPVGYSYLDLYVTFKLSDALLQSNDKFQLMLQLAESMGKRSDGFYGFRMTGSFNRLGPVQWMKTSPFPAVGTRAAAGTAPTPVVAAK